MNFEVMNSPIHYRKKGDELSSHFTTENLPHSKLPPPNEYREMLVLTFSHETPFLLLNEESYHFVAQKGRLRKSIHLLWQS